MSTSDSSGASMSRRRRVVTGLAALVTAAAILAGLGALALGSHSPVTSAVAAETSPTSAALAPGLEGSDTGPSASAQPTEQATAQAPASFSAAGVKNVVLILADDLDVALFNQVPRLAALQSRGMTFLNNSVTDSLCCPSRVSIFRGQYIHNHKVVSNIAASGGGWPTFRRLGEQRDCLPVWLHNAGINTGMFGKYLNEYPGTDREARYIPPGWDTWVVPTSHGDTYSGFNYTLNDGGRLIRHGAKPQDFLNDVITREAVSYIETAPEGFFAELATYSPHKPAPVAPRNAGTHLADVVPRTPNYNAVGTREPDWIRSRAALGPRQRENLDRLWRQRAQSAESVADSVDEVMAALERSGRADDTLVIITSDNGYHAGAHRLPKGKRTAYREDAIVPMVVIGPGVPAGTSFRGMTSTIDLSPTITEVLDTSAPAWVDGRSLVPILGTGLAPAAWRTATLSESMGLSAPGDPDYQTWAPPQFSALRSEQWLYVVYEDGERELYDLVADPYELTNVVDTTDPAIVSELNSQLLQMHSCSGDTCRVYDALPQPAAPGLPSAEATTTPSATPSVAAGAPAS